MISVAEARARVLAGLRPVAAEIVSLADAHGRVLADPVRARIANPQADVSAMDGYALASEGTGPVFTVVGEAPAGHPWQGHVGPGEAVRLFTGSIVPAGTDRIVIQENTERTLDRLTVQEVPAAGRHIRRAGQDFAAGDVLLRPGQRLNARTIGLAAAANHPWMRVHRRPRVAILATGDEVALPGEPIPPGGLVSSNGHAIAALVRSSGGDPTLLPVVSDDRSALADALSGTVRGADILVTTGGASVGDHDLVRDALVHSGFNLDFWQVAMRPGKPLMHGHLQDLPVLGLPGNPVSALVTAILFLLPALARLSGAEVTDLPITEARLTVPMVENDNRADFVRTRLARIGPEWHATPFDRQDSAMMRALAEADGLLLRVPRAPAARAGDIVEIFRFADINF